MISPGVTLGGRYRLDERIAGGGMGDVWRGTDEVLGRTVAVKILLPALLDEPGFAERFRGEARTMATINHPGVVDVYDYGSDQQLAFLVMEYVEGDALSRTLSRVGRLTPARTMALVAQAADALQAAHANGIVHRDVKPGNLLVRPNGTLVLTDFGIARSALVGQLTVAGSVLGTASYISPEQASGAVATAASDVYALGVVAYQCLSGHRPFDGATPIEIAMKHVRDNPRPLPADIPPAVRSIVDRAMAKDPGARWPTAAAMAGGRPPGRVLIDHRGAAAGRQRQRAGRPAAVQRAADEPAAQQRPGIESATFERPVVRPARAPDVRAGAAAVPAGAPPGFRCPGSRCGLGAAGATAVPASLGAADGPAAGPAPVSGRQGGELRQPAGADRAGGGARPAGAALCRGHFVPAEAGQHGRSGWWRIAALRAFTRAWPTEGTAVASYRLMKQAAGPRGLHDASEGRQTL